MGQAIVEILTNEGDWSFSGKVGKQVLSLNQSCLQKIHYLREG